MLTIMKVLTEVAVIGICLVVSIAAGYFLYAVVEGIRLDLYCKELREGLDCYQEGWVTYPVWLLSLTGGCIAALSIISVSIFRSYNRVRSCTITLVIGSALALPLTVFIGGPLVFFITVLSGALVLMAVKHVAF